MPECQSAGGAAGTPAAPSTARIVGRESLSGRASRSSEEWAGGGRRAAAGGRVGSGVENGRRGRRAAWLYGEGVVGGGGRSRT